MYGPQPDRCMKLLHGRMKERAYSSDVFPIHSSKVIRCEKSRDRWSLYAGFRKRQFKMLGCWSLSRPYMTCPPISSSHEEPAIVREADYRLHPRKNMRVFLRLGPSLWNAHLKRPEAQNEAPCKQPSPNGGPANGENGGWLKGLPS